MILVSVSLTSVKWRNLQFILGWVALNYSETTTNKVFGVAVDVDEIINCK